MALLYSDNFVSTNLSRVWQNQVGTPAVGSGDGIGGLDTIQFTSTEHSRIDLTQFRSANPVLRAAWWSRIGNAPATTSRGFIAVEGNGAYLNPIQVDNTGYMKWSHGDLPSFSFGSGGYDALAYQMADNAWHHYELWVDYATGVNDRKLWIDGVLVHDELSAIGAALTDIEYFHLGGPAAGTTYHAALVLWDDTGTDFTGQMGIHTIDTLHPTSAGTTTDWTASPAVANYLNVDDTGGPDDDTTYNHATTAADRDLYNLGALADTPDTIFGVGHHLHAAADDAGTVDFRSVCKSGATTVTGATETLSGTAYDEYYSPYGQDPNGGPAAWTKTTVEAAEFGQEIV